ncbi:MAG: hypothetical protein HC866_16965 [Leptolyngbyaceae cyanobacterium RU_5_1]|nr:hypothetical protein [Leptolyngbyaceae cyanobacterium RU_5_1]
MADSAFDTIIVHNQDALEELAWAIAASQGQFSLVLARCNYTQLRDHLVEQLQEQCPVKLRVTRLRQTSKTLYTKIREEIGAEPAEALMVLGLETVNELNEMLPAMNSVREEFRKNFPFPIAIWVTDDVRRKLVQLAPDFESWATTTTFSMPPDALLVALRDASDRLFTALLTPDSNRSFRRLLENLDLGFLQRSEIEFALQDLHQSNQPLTPDLQATLDFIRGLNAPSNEQALEYFQRSLAYWQGAADGATDETDQLSAELTSNVSVSSATKSVAPCLITGLLLYFVGRTIYNICSENKYRDRNWEPAKQPLQDCVTVFEQAGRPDLVAKSINQFERVLDRLQAWDELEVAAQKSVPLQETASDRGKLAQDYRYLAMVALDREQGADAKRYAQLALDTMKQVPADRRYQGVYLWTLAQAEKLLGERDAAIAHLIEARLLGDQGFPRVYIGILEDLRDCYLEQKDYRVAFRLKQERLSIEQQYQLRAFVGAGRLRPQLQDQELIEAKTP